MTAGSLTLAAGSLLDHSAEAAIAATAAAGFTGVGLRLSGEHAVADPTGLAVAAQAAGIAIDDVEVYRIGAARADPRPLFAAAAAAGARRVLAVSDLADPGATERAVHELVVLAAEHGLVLGVEYMAWTTPATPAAAVELAQRTGCSVVVDLLHHVRVGAGVAELDAVVASGTLGWVQLCDGPAARPPDAAALLREARHQRLPPGAGELPLTALLARLPHDTPIAVEVQSDALSPYGAVERARLLRAAADAVLAELPGTVA